MQYHGDLWYHLDDVIVWCAASCAIGIIIGLMAGMLVG